MGRQHSNIESQFSKQKKFNVTITTRIHGDLKNKFMHDLYLKGVSESELVREIISLHYEIVDKFELHKKDFHSMKKHLF